MSNLRHLKRAVARTPVAARRNARAALAPAGLALAATFAVVPAANASRVQPFSGSAPVNAATFEAMPAVPTLYVPVAFEGDAVEGDANAYWTKAEIERAAGVAGSAGVAGEVPEDSVRSYFRVSSNGKLDLEPTVLGWTRVKIPAPVMTLVNGKTSYGCEKRREFRTQVDAAIEAQHKVVLSNYRRIVYLTPPQLASTPKAEECPHDGVSVVPDNASWIFAPTERAKPDPKRFERLVNVSAHEIMHSLGLNHQLGLNCKRDGAFAPISDECTASDADQSDLMSGPSLPITGPHRIALGLMPFEKLKTVPKPAAGSPETIDLRSLDQDPESDQPQVLRIRRSGALAANPSEKRPYLYLDYRSVAEGSNRFAPGPANEELSVFRGVTLRTGPAYEIGDTSTPSIEPMTVNASVGRGYTAGPSWNARSLFVPAGGTGRADQPDPDVALKVGQSFYDPVEDLTITTQSVDGVVAKVVLSAGPPPNFDQTSLSLVDDKLRVVGRGDQVNNIVVSRQGSEVFVSDFGNSLSLSASATCRRVAPQTAACRLADLASVEVYGGNGDDTVAIADSMPDSLPTLLNGGAGRDSLEGGPGPDTIDGGTEADAIDGGAGTDTVTYATRTNPVTIAPSLWPRQDKIGWRMPRGSGELGENDGISRETENLIGGSGADTIIVAIEPYDESKYAQPRRTIDPGPGADRVTLGVGPVTLDTLDGGADAAINCRSAATTWTADAADADVSTGTCGTPSPTPTFDITDMVPGRPLTRGTRAQVKFTTNLPGATFECALDRPGSTGTFAACQSGWTQTGLANGDHTLRLRMKSSGGTVVAAESHPFTIDTAAPTATIGGASSTTDRTPTVSLGASRSGSTFECRVNGGDWAGCPAEYTLAPQTAGTATVVARAISPAGVVGPESATKTITFTAPVPDAVRTGGLVSGSTIHHRQPSLQFAAPTGSSGLTFTCQLDREPNPPLCGSPSVTMWDVSNGPHLLTVTATDQHGNVDSTPLRVPFTVEAPALSLTSPARDAWSNSRTPQFTFAVKDADHGPYTYKCRITYVGEPGVTNEPCTPGEPFVTDRSGLDDKNKKYLFIVDMRDAQGLVTRLYEYDGLRIDSETPTLTVGGPADGATVTAAGATFTVDSPDWATPNCETNNNGVSCVRFEAQLDGGGWGEITREWKTGALSPGQHQVEFRARDLAGNVSATQLRRVGVPATTKLLTVSTPVASPAAVPLTTDPALGAAADWIHWKGATATSFDRKTGTPVIQSWTAYAGNTDQTLGTVTGASVFSWTNASGATPTGNSAIGVTGGGRNGRGFSFAVPAKNTETRKLTVWFGLRGAGTTGALTAKFGDNVVVDKQVPAASNGSWQYRTATIEFRPLSATDTLTVSWFQGGGTMSSSNQVALFAAALY